MPSHVTKISSHRTRFSSRRNMEELSFLIGILANIITSMVYLSPAGTFCRIVKNRSTEEFESLPYICMLLNASMWTYYGIIKPGGFLVATVNGFGAVLLCIYLLLFIFFAPPKMKAKTAVLASILDVGVVLGAAMGTRLTLDREAQITCIGFLCTGFTIISYGSPLAAMKIVVTTKSVEYMPFFLSFSLCISGFMWAFYAILVNDYFIGVPNGTGSLLGACQLIVYFMYRNSNPSKHAVAVLEEGSPHEPLIPSSDELLK